MSGCKSRPQTSSGTYITSAIRAGVGFGSGTETSPGVATPLFHASS